jgi:diguanylate cyclase (GGDEF)-like protein
MIDIDHFKAVNDTHGHATGDVVLQRAGQRIASALRISDFVARWGGEEFCVLLPNTTEEGALTALNKALTEVRNVSFNAPDGSLFSVTFSAGLASLDPGTDPESAIAEADRLLYMAKQAGRNRVLSPSGAEAPLRPMVMLVEDEPNVAKLVTGLLEKEGFAVAHYGDAESAMEAWQREAFALVITDIGLPGVSGFELVKHIRASRALATLPILMLTGSDEEESVVKGFELGANDYVTKPFHTAELALRIRRLINRR